MMPLFKTLTALALGALALTAQAAPEKFLTYNQATEVNLRDAAGMEADARETNVLIAEGNGFKDVVIACVLALGVRRV